MQNYRVFYLCTGRWPFKNLATWALCQSIQKWREKGYSHNLTDANLNLIKLKSSIILNNPNHMCCLRESESIIVPIAVCCIALSPWNGTRVSTVCLYTAKERLIPYLVYVLCYVIYCYIVIVSIYKIVQHCIIYCYMETCSLICLAQCTYTMGRRKRNKG